MTLIDRMLELRRTVPDGTILDWLDLSQLVPEGTGSLPVEVLREHWNCTQPTISRRMARLVDAGLISTRRGWGRYKVVRIEQP